MAVSDPPYRIDNEEVDAHRKLRLELVAVVGKQVAEAKTHNNHNTPLKPNLLSAMPVHITLDGTKYANFILERNSGPVRAPQQN
jgi:hypothetical protein